MSHFTKEINEPLLSEGGSTAIDDPPPANQDAKKMMGAMSGLGALGATVKRTEADMEEADVLTRQQVNQCIMEIADQNPLRSRVQIEHICTCLTYCWNKRAPNFRQSLRFSLLQELSSLGDANVVLKPPKNKQQLMDDPYLLLGYGVNAYFGTMMHLAKMFAMITLFILPVLIAIFKNPAQYLNNGGPLVNRFSLGNLGGAEVQCNLAQIENKGVGITCPQGTQIKYYNDGKGEIHFGIIPKLTLLQDYCLSTKITNDYCADYTNKAHIQKQLDSCSKSTEGKQQCKLTFVDANGDLQIFKDEASMNKKAKNNCDDKSKFFIQYACVYPKEQQANREICGLLIASIGILVYCFTVIYLDYIRAVEKNMYVDFDVATVTAGDYTIEFDLKPESFDHFKEVYHDKNCPMSEMAQFRLYIQKELEDRVSEFPDLGFDEIAIIDPDATVNQSVLETKKSKKSKHQQKVEARKSMKSNQSYLSQGTQGPKRINIAQITFAFFNSEIIALLRKRGGLIGTENWADLKQANADINEKIQDKKILNQLQTPCSVFVTFETEEGYQRGKMYNELVQDSVENFQMIITAKKQNEKIHELLETRDNFVQLYFRQLLGQQVDLQEASEPTDIIWENREVTPKYRRKCTLAVWIIIAILLSISGVIIYYCSYTSSRLKLRYPTGSCDPVDERYHNGQSEYMQNAFMEYLLNEQLKEEQKPTQYTAVMRCFCKHKGKENKKEEYEMEIDGKTEKQAFCAKYFDDKNKSKALGFSISFIIIFINTVLRMVIIKLIESIKHDTYSARLASITNGVFFATFFNTGILLVLVNANMSEHESIYFAQYVQSGLFFDYTPMWYSVVGSKIVKAMIINSIMPYITVVTSICIPWVLRRMDTGGNPYKSKKTSMAKYKLAHGGKDYIIHFKYSNVLNIVYITMTYGIGMPILFPIAVFNFLNQWICERVVVAYCMRLPPALDDKLIRNSLHMMRFAPLLFLGNGYWMASSRQIFYNEYNFKDFSHEGMKSGHFFLCSTGDHALPLAIFALVHFILICFTLFGAELMIRLGFTMGAQEIDIDEDLPKFFKSVTLTQADEMVIKDNYMKQRFGFEQNDPDTIQILDATKMPRKAIQGTPWYLLLSNSSYSESFNYIGPHIKEREKLIEDGDKDRCITGENDKPTKELTMECKRDRWEQSDLVLIIMNLAFLPDEVIKKIDFTKEQWSVKFKQNMDEYKKQFEERTGKQWQYQTNKVEQEYQQFIKEQKKEDKYLQKDIIEEKTLMGLQSFITDKFKKKEQVADEGETAKTN